MTLSRELRDCSHTRGWPYIKVAPDLLYDWAMKAEELEAKATQPDLETVEHRIVRKILQRLASNDYLCDSEGCRCGAAGVSPATWDECEGVVKVELERLRFAVASALVEVSLKGEKDGS